MTVVGVLLTCAAGLLVVMAQTVKRCLRLVAPHEVLIVKTAAGLRARFGGAIVPPVIGTVEVMDVRVKMIHISRRGQAAYVSADGKHVDADAVFYVRVHPTVEDMCRVATAIGAIRAGDVSSLRDEFAARFDDAVAAVVAARTFDEAADSRLQVIEEVLAEIGPDLDGFVVDTVAITRLARRP